MHVVHRPDYHPLYPYHIQKIVRKATADECRTGQATHGSIHKEILKAGSVQEEGNHPR